MDDSVDAHPGSLQFGCGSAALALIPLFRKNLNKPLDKFLGATKFRAIIHSGGKSAERSSS